MDSEENGQDEDHIICPAVKAVENLRLNLERMTQEQRRYQDRGLEAMAKVSSMHTSISQIHEDTKHLGELRKIAEINSGMAETIKDFSNEFRDLKNNTFKIATDSWRVPMPVFLIVVGIMVLIMGLRELGDRPLTASATHFGINHTTKDDK